MAPLDTSRDNVLVTLPPGIVLPYYADLADASSDISAGKVQSTTSRTYAIGSGLAVMINVFMSITTSATVGNRFPVLAIQNDAAVSIFQVPSPAAAIASTTCFMSWSIGFAGAYSANIGGGTLQCAPLPATLLLPSWTVIAQIFGSQAGDTITQVGFNALVIPTQGEDIPVFGQNPPQPLALT